MPDELHPHMPREVQSGGAPTALALDGHVPPHDLEAEAACLSAILVQPGAFDETVDVLKPEHFYSESHRRIFEACLELAKKSAPIDVVQVAGVLRDWGRLEQVGGRVYLTDVLVSAPVVANVRAYAERVKKKAKVRAVIAASQRIAAHGYVDAGDADEFCDAAVQSLHEIAFEQTRSNLELISGPLFKGFEEANEAAKRGHAMMGTPTGFGNYDAVTAGLHKTELTLVAARPGTGKTSLLLQWAMNIARRGEGVCVFSMETLKRQMAIRAACNEGRVDFHRLRTGRMTPADWHRLTDAARIISPLPFWIDDQPAITSLEFRAKLRRAIAEAHRKGVRLTVAFVDYLQLMKGMGENTVQQMSEVARSLKNTANELEIAIVALAQLNRDVEKRASGRPQLSDLRESGELEQAADNVCFLWRESKDGGRNEDVVDVTLTVEKQRSGPGQRDLSLRFVRAFTRFEIDESGEHYDAA